MKNFVIGCITGVVVSTLFICIILVVLSVTGTIKFTAGFNSDKNLPSNSTVVKEDVKTTATDEPIIKQDDGTEITDVKVKEAVNKEVKELTDLVELYLAKVDADDDEYIYNKLFHSAFRDSYTLEQISSIHDSIRKLNGIKNYNLNDADIKMDRDANGRKYEISLPVEYTNYKEVVSVKAVDENNKLKILAFKFKPYDK